jgi:NAD(P)-dependent dehydrogenase (short-subunit alcohol dehydrogenase family)
VAAPSSEAIQASSEEQEPQQNVLIVGAGPIGLATALCLAQAGLVVDIIETEQKLSEEPRAVTYYASALTALDKMGIIPDMKKAGFVSAGFAGASLSDMMDRAAIEWVMLSVEDLFPVITMRVMALGGYCICHRLSSLNCFLRKRLRRAWLVCILGNGF